jgi:hypothetical protein
MRKVLAGLVAGICLFGAVPNVASAGQYTGPGQYVGQPSPVVVALFAQFPQGGDGLVNAVRELLISNPELADDVAFVASRGSVGQQVAAAIGMAQAYDVFVMRGNGRAAAIIAKAGQDSTSPIIQTQILNAAGTSNGGGTLYEGRQINSNPNTVACQTVSPTDPNKGC